MEVKTNEVQKSHLERAVADSLMAEIKHNQCFNQTLQGTYSRSDI